MPTAQWSGLLHRGALCPSPPCSVPAEYPTPTPHLCLVVGFSKWRGQQETGGLDWSQAEVEVCIALPRLQALSHLSSQGSPFHGTGSHPSPHPARPRPAKSSPLLLAPAPPRTLHPLGLPTSAPTLVKSPGRKAWLHHFI